MTQLDLVSKEVPYQHCLKKSEDEGKVLIKISITITITPGLALTLVKAMASEVLFRKNRQTSDFAQYSYANRHLSMKKDFDLRSTSTTPLPPPRRRSVQCNMGSYLRRGGGLPNERVGILLTKLRGVICKFWSHLGCSESHNY